MSDSKAWYQSKAIWGALIAGASAIAGVIFHKTIPADQQAALVDAALAIAGAIGTILGVYGRVTATTQIGGSK